MEPAKLREGLRKEGLYVAEGDPVLELVAICEVALADTVKTIERLTKQQTDRITAASTQAVVDAKRAAELLITEAGQWTEGRIKAAGEAAAVSVIAALQQEVAKATHASLKATRAAWIAAIVAAVALSGVGGMLAATLR